MGRDARQLQELLGDGRLQRRRQDLRASSLGGVGPASAERREPLVHVAKGNNLTGRRPRHRTGARVPELTRREFLKMGAGGAAGIAVVGNPLGFDLRAAKKRQLQLRIAGAKESKSVCPYCAVGCALIAYTKEVNGKTQILQIEGDPDSPVNEGRLCPKGATAMQLATSTRRVEHPMYRAPGSANWEQKDWNFVLDKIAQNIKAS